MNVWTFNGRLGADAELRTTQSGEKVLNLSVANDIGFGDRKETQWVKCSFWGRRAEALAPHLTRGKQVMISGEVRIETYERRNGGGTASCLSVRINDIDLFGGGSAGEHGSGHGRSDRTSDRGTGGYGGRHDEQEDSIPF